MVDGNIEFDIVVDASERIQMIGAGTAFVHTPTAWRAMNVSTWTSLWTSNLALEPVVASPNGAVGMRDLSTGMLHELDSTGTSVASGASGGRWAHQVAFGLWADVSGGGNSPVLVARISLPLNEAKHSSIFFGDPGSRQRAPKVDPYKDRETAALHGLEKLETLTRSSGFEWGGQVCKTTEGFELSEFRTSKLKDRIEPKDMPETLCGNPYAAYFHTHPLPDELDYFSGPDLDKVDAHKKIPYYLLAPRPSGLPDVKPTAFRILKIWNADDNRPTYQNLCIRHPDGSWGAFYQGGRCDTPKP